MLITKKRLLSYYYVLNLSVKNVWKFVSFSLYRYLHNILDFSWFTKPKIFTICTFTETVC